MIVNESTDRIGDWLAPLERPATPCPPLGLEDAIAHLPISTPLEPLGSFRGHRPNRRRNAPSTTESLISPMTP